MTHLLITFEATTLYSESRYAEGSSIKKISHGFASAKTIATL
jgi:hypothetical protein